MLSMFSNINIVMVTSANEGDFHVELSTDISVLIK